MLYSCTAVIALLDLRAAKLEKLYGKFYLTTTAQLVLVKNALNSLKPQFSVKILQYSH